MLTQYYLFINQHNQMFIFIFGLYIIPFEIYFDINISFSQSVSIIIFRKWYLFMHKHNLDQLLFGRKIFTS